MLISPENTEIEISIASLKSYRFYEDKEHVLTADNQVLQHIRHILFLNHMYFSTPKNKLKELMEAVKSREALRCNKCRMCSCNGFISDRLDSVYEGLKYLLEEGNRYKYCYDEIYDDLCVLIAAASQNHCLHAVSETLNLAVNILEDSYN